ncbi:TonB-dependent receptor family protein [Yersinia ruckeri]|uniref:TonB-dependent receptor family protein n=2 Tax=Yersinia ruckeri TaxID=29486 RepID=UPI002263DE0B|nr:TonB-dependent receptor [Yersinia ruckeri]UZX67504.1 TonB-dependent receptor [Yersinia ruckeri]
MNGCYKSHLLLSFFIFISSIPLSINATEDNKQTNMEVIGQLYSEYGIARSSYQQEQQKLARIAGGTNLMTPGEEGRLGTLQDALDYQPGLVIQNFFGGVDQPRLNIRGSGVQSAPLSRGVTLLQDGLPLNDADGGFHISLLEPRESQFISVIRGANAVSPVSNALGGELDFISYTGADETGRVRYEYGSFGRQGWQGALGGRDGDLDGRISISGDRFNGYRQHSASRRNAVRANLGYEGENFASRTWFSWTDLAFDVAGSLSQEQLKANPRSVFPLVLVRDPHRNVEQARIANRMSWHGDNRQHQLGLWAQHTHDNFVTPVVYVLSGGNTYGAQWLTHLQQGQWHYRLGASTDRSDMERDLHQNRRGKPDNYKLIGAYNMLAQNHNLAFGAGWKPNEQWRIDTDLKGTRAVRNALSKDGRSGLDQHWYFLSPKLGVIWTPNPQQRWFGSLNWSNEAPSFREIISNKGLLTPLRPQQAVTLEMGGSGTLTRHIKWDLALYRSLIADELITTYDSEGNSVGTFNYGSNTVHQGIEMGFKGHIPMRDSSIEYRFAWTYNDFRFKGGEYAGKRIGGIPPQLISAEVLYQWQRWSIGPNLHWLPEITPVDHLNRTQIQARDKYAVWGIKMDYRHPDGWSAYLSMDNLTDKRYATASVTEREVTSKQSKTLFPGMGRSINGGFTYTF